MAEVESRQQNELTRRIRKHQWLLNELKKSEERILAALGQFSTQREAAEVLGVRPQFVNDLLRGRRTLSRKLVARLTQ